MMKRIIALGMMTALIHGPAYSAWKDMSGSLPGLEKNGVGKILVVAGVGAAAVVTWALVKRRHVDQPIHATTSIQVAPSETGLIEIENRGKQDASLSELLVSHGFELTDRPALPVLLRANGGRLQLRVKSPSNKAAKGSLQWIVISGSKTFNGAIRLRSKSVIGRSTVAAAM